MKVLVESDLHVYCTQTQSNLEQVDFWLHTRPITWRGIIPPKCYFAHKGGYCTSNHISALVSLWGVGGTDTIQQSSLGYYHIVHVQLAHCSTLDLQGQAVTSALTERTAITVLLYTSLDYVGTTVATALTPRSWLTNCVYVHSNALDSQCMLHTTCKKCQVNYCVLTLARTHYVTCTAAVNVISASLLIRLCTC